MSTISISTPSDGQTIDAADVNTPLNTIVAAINGNLDDTNIASGANINGTKLLANSIPPTAYNSDGRGGWNAGIITVMPTVVANGNRSYDLTFASTDLTTYLSPGQRLKLTRTVTAPTQCTSLNGTTQYYSKSSPTGMTFTDDFVVSAWVKLSSYPTSAGEIASRYNGTSGWEFRINSTGQVLMIGYNAGAANYSQILSYQSVPLNKWVHITGQLDMSSFTATTTTSYIMIDGVDVPTAVSRSGTAPTALIQAGDLNIGARNAGADLFFPGKIAQVAIYSAKVTQATIKASMNQTLSGSETSLISAYSFNNSINDLSANANNLTANGSATATNADTPFTQTQTGVTTGTTNYGIITAASFSTNTTLTVQVPEGDTIPTSGGVSAVSYSTQKVPYGFPAQRGKWRIESTILSQQSAGPVASATWTNIVSFQLNIPVGEWVGGYTGLYQVNVTTPTTQFDVFATLSSSTSTESEKRMTTSTTMGLSVANLSVIGLPTTKEKSLTTTTQTPMYLLVKHVASSTGTLYVRGDNCDCSVYAELAYL